MTSSSHTGDKFVPRNQNFAAEVVNLACEFQEAVKIINGRYGVDFELRIGYVDYMHRCIVQLVQRKPVDMDMDMDEALFYLYFH